MNGGNYWKRFEESGRVADYLAYAGEKKEERPQNGYMTAGEYPYAGSMLGDRDGDKPDAGRGI